MFSSTLFVFCRIYCLHVFCSVCFYIIVVTMTKGLFVCCLCLHVCFLLCLLLTCLLLYGLFVYNGFYYLFSVYMFVFMLCLLILLVVVCDSVVACLYLMCLDLNVCLLWSRITWRNVNIQKKQYISALFKNIIKKNCKQHMAKCKQLR